MNKQLKGFMEHHGLDTSTRTGYIASRAFKAGFAAGQKVKLAKDIVVKWDKIPKKYKYVARDEDGRWWAFTTKPGRGIRTWQCKDEYDLCYQPLDRGEAVGNGAPAWERSLVKRPRARA